MFTLPELVELPESAIRRTNVFSSEILAKITGKKVTVAESSRRKIALINKAPNLSRSPIHNSYIIRTNAIVSSTRGFAEKILITDSTYQEIKSREFNWLTTPNITFYHKKNKQIIVDNIKYLNLENHSLENNSLDKITPEFIPLAKVENNRRQLMVDLMDHLIELDSKRFELINQLEPNEDFLTIIQRCGKKFGRIFSEL